MKCVNCGTELEEGARFCGNCGNPVESTEEVIDSAQSIEPEVETQPEPVVEEPVVEEPVVEEPVVEEQPVSEDQPVFSSEVSNEPQEERQEIVQEPIPVDTPEFKEQQEKGKKSSGAVKFILIIIILLALAAAGFFAYTKFFNKEEKFENSVDAVEKSVSNLLKEKDSMTVETKIELEIKNSISLNVKAALEYQNDNGTYRIHGKLDKNPVTDQIDVYAEIDEGGLAIFVPGTVLKLADSSFKSLKDTDYVKLQASFDELGVSLAEIKENFAEMTADIDLTEVLNEDNFKYVGKKDGIKQYSITIDKSYLDSFKDELEDADLPIDSLDEIGDMKFDINLFVDENNVLVGIDFDLTNALKEATDEIDKAIISISFKGINSTKIEIPSSVRNGSIDINTLRKMTETKITGTLPQTTKLF